MKTLGGLEMGRAERLPGLTPGEELLFEVARRLGLDPDAGFTEAEIMARLATETARREQAERDLARIRVLLSNAAGGSATDDPDHSGWDAKRWAEHVRERQAAIVLVLEGIFGSSMESLGQPYGDSFDAVESGLYILQRSLCARIGCTNEELRAGFELGDSDDDLRGEAPPVEGPREPTPTSAKGRERIRRLRRRVEWLRKRDGGDYDRAEVSALAWAISILERGGTGKREAGDHGE